jgi:hypothetical protein
MAIHIVSRSDHLTRGDIHTNDDHSFIVFFWMMPPTLEKLERNTFATHLRMHDVHDDRSQHPLQRCTLMCDEK